MNRLRWGIVLIVLSYVLGWPAVALFGGLATYFDDMRIVTIGGTSVYAFSWLLIPAGIYVGGPEAMKAVKKWIQERKRS